MFNFKEFTENAEYYKICGLPGNLIGQYQIGSSQDSIDCPLLYFLFKTKSGYKLTFISCNYDGYNEFDNDIERHEGSYAFDSNHRIISSELEKLINIPYKRIQKKDLRQHFMFISFINIALSLS